LFVVILIVEQAYSDNLFFFSRNLQFKMANMFYTTKPWGATWIYKSEPSPCRFSNRALITEAATQAINVRCKAISNRLSGSSFDAVEETDILAPTNGAMTATPAMQNDSDRLIHSSVTSWTRSKNAATKLQETPGTLEYARIHREDDPVMHLVNDALAGIPASSSCGRSAENVDHHGNSETKCAERQKSLDHQQGLSLDDDFDEVPLSNNDYPGWYFNYLERLTTAKSCSWKIANIIPALPPTFNKEGNFTSLTFHVSVVSLPFMFTKLEWDVKTRHSELLATHESAIQKMKTTIGVERMELLAIDVSSLPPKNLFGGNDHAVVWFRLNGWVAYLLQRPKLCAHQRIPPTCPDDGCREEWNGNGMSTLCETCTVLKYMKEMKAECAQIWDEVWIEFFLKHKKEEA
jgi:hypothetical protein